MPIKLENISYTYAQGSPFAVHALNDISLELSAGEYVGLVGAPGSGKSALLRLMAGLITPDGGQFFIDGEAVDARKNAKSTRAELLGRVALLPEGAEGSLFETTVYRELAFSLRGRGLAREDISARAREALMAVGMDYDALCGASPLALPLAARRRLALACALMTSPEYLLLDEPLKGLDAPARRELMDIFDALNSRGMGIVLASAESDDIAERAGRVLVMCRGALIRDGSARGVFSDYYDLARHGVAVPCVKAASQLLRERGVDMPANVVRYDEFIDRLKIIMWRKGL